MAKAGGDLLWKLAESDEIDIETRRDPKSPLHRTTIWIVPTKDGVYIRSANGKKGRWYQEAVANPHVTIRGRPAQARRAGGAGEKSERYSGSQCRLSRKVRR